jgi:hypothetical protein
LARLGITDRISGVTDVFLQQVFRFMKFYYVASNSSLLDVFLVTLFREYRMDIVVKAVTEEIAVVSVDDQKRHTQWFLNSYIPNLQEKELAFRMRFKKQEQQPSDAPSSSGFRAPPSSPSPAELKKAPVSTHRSRNDASLPSSSSAAAAASVPDTVHGLEARLERLRITSGQTLDTSQLIQRKRDIITRAIFAENNMEGRDRKGSIAIFPSCTGIPIAEYDYMSNEANEPLVLNIPKRISSIESSQKLVIAERIRTRLEEFDVKQSLHWLNVADSCTLGSCPEMERMRSFLSSIISALKSIIFDNDSFLTTYKDVRSAMVNVFDASIPLNRCDLDTTFEIEYPDKTHTWQPVMQELRLRSIDNAMYYNEHYDRTQNDVRDMVLRSSELADALRNVRVFLRNSSNVTENDNTPIQMCADVYATFSRWFTWDFYRHFPNRRKIARSVRDVAKILRDEA